MGNRGSTNDAAREKQAHNQRTKSLMLLQQDLFIMTTTTVFRNLEEENYPVTTKLKDSFNPKDMYKKALQQDVPWRRWQFWIREQIMKKMIRTGAIEPPQSMRSQRKSQ